MLFKVLSHGHHQISSSVYEEIGNNLQRHSKNSHQH
jgi:hypothetical protein